MRPNNFVPNRNVEILPPPRLPNPEGIVAREGEDFIQAPFPHPLQLAEPVCISQAFHP